MAIGINGKIEDNRSRDDRMTALKHAVIESFQKSVGDKLPEEQTQIIAEAISDAFVDGLKAANVSLLDYHN